MKAQTFIDIIKIKRINGKWAVFVGLNISGADNLAIAGGEDAKGFHVTLLYGYYKPFCAEDETGALIEAAINDVKEQIPDSLVFDAEGRFEATDSSDGKDVIYARVKQGQLEDVHEALLGAMKERGLTIEETFDVYQPHMTLAYIEPGAEHELKSLDHTATIDEVKYGYGEVSTHEYESTIKKTEEPQTFNILKTDDDKRLIFGWASVAIKTNGEQVLDWQNDMIDPEDLEEAVYTYVLDFRDSGEEHIPGLRKKARMVESCMFTKEKMQAMGIPEGIVPEGWWIGFYVDDDEAWAKVKDGTYQMFSIEGQGIREAVEDEEDVKKNDEFEKSAGESPAKRPSVAQTCANILKFNPFHDARGRFSNKNSFSTYSANPKTKAGAMAIGRSFKGGHGSTFNAHKESQGENINQNHAWLQGGPGAKILSAQGQLASQQAKKPPVAPKTQPAPPKPQQAPQKPPQKPQVQQKPQVPQKNYDKLGYADHDDADYHQLYNGKQYYQQQKLTAAQKQAASNYLEADTEPGSLYSHSQNMNHMMATGQTLTGKYKQTYDGLMSSMHNLGYNLELTRYDHDGMLNSMLKASGAKGTVDTMTVSQIKKSLVGSTMNENKLLSVSYNDFKNAPASSTNVFTNRRVKVTYKAKASTQAMMPGNGPGGSLGELILAPTNGKNNPAGKIIDIKLTGNRARNKGTQTLNKQQIEIVVEI